MTQLDLLSNGIRTYDGSRDELDRYYTPLPIVDALIARQARADALRAPLVLEPCAGRQCSIAHALRDWSKLVGYRVVTADLDRAAPVDHHGDACELDWGAVLDGLGAELFDYVISNPPFKLIPELVRALTPFTRELTFLVRLSFIEPVRARVDILKPFQAPCHATGDMCTWRIVRRLPTPRQQFRTGISLETGKRTSVDSVTTEWVTWARVTPGLQVPPFDLIDREEEEHWAIARYAGRIGKSFDGS